MCDSTLVDYFTEEAEIPIGVDRHFSFDVLGGVGLKMGEGQFGKQEIEEVACLLDLISGESILL